MSGRNTKIPKVEIKLQEVENTYVKDSMNEFIKSMLFELADEYNKNIVIQKKEEFIQYLSRNYLSNLLENILHQHTNLEWVAIRDIITILESFDNLINEIDSHNPEMEGFIRRQNEVLCRSMSEFSKHWEDRYKDMFTLKS